MPSGGIEYHEFRKNSVREIKKIAIVNFSSCYIFLPKYLTVTPIGLSAGGLTPGPLFGLVEEWAYRP